MLIMFLSSASLVTSTLRFYPISRSFRKVQNTPELSESIRTMITQVGTNTTNQTASPDSLYYTIAISGANGLVGNALLHELKSRNYLICNKQVQLIQLVRQQKNENPPTPPFIKSVYWDPQQDDDKMLQHLTTNLQSVDAVINLSGENIATGLGSLGFLGLRPWTPQKKKSILASRIPGAKLLSKVVQQISSCCLDNNNRPRTYLCASGVGIYGYHYEDSMEAVDESMNTDKTEGFLATVSRQWEEAANSSAPSNTNNNNLRAVQLRFGVVLSTKGGALGKLYPIYYLGGGGVVGSGKQSFSYISATDVARAILHVLETPTLQGPVNLTSPQPCTYRDFNDALGKVLHRPTLFPLPSFAVKLLFGEMGQEMLLGGVKVKPTKLLESGFEFKHDTIEKAVKSAVTDTKI